MLFEKPTRAPHVGIDFIHFNECMLVSNIIDQCCEFLSQDQWYQEHFIMLLNSLTKAQDNKKNKKVQFHMQNETTTLAINKDDFN